MAQRPRGRVARRASTPTSSAMPHQLLDDLEAALAARGGRDRSCRARTCPNSVSLARARVGRHRLALAVAAGEPAALERAPDDGAEAEALADREDVALDVAREDRVRRLRRDEALELSALADPQRLDHAPAAELQVDRIGERAGRDAEVAHLALAHEVGERAERLLERRVAVVAVQSGRDRSSRCRSRRRLSSTCRKMWRRDVPRSSTPPGAGHEDLGGEHDLLAPAAQRLADDLLRLAPAVAVGGVDEVDALVERAVHDAHAVVVIGVAPAPEHHRAEAEARDLEAAVPESDVLHGYAARASVIACRRSRSSGATLLGKKARTSPSLPTTYLQKFQLGASPPRVRKA